MLDDVVETCGVERFCANFDAKCWLCRAKHSGYDELYYKPRQDEPKAPKLHPIREKEKEQKAADRKREKKAPKPSKDPKQLMAALMEQKATKMAKNAISRRLKTEFAKPTVNSGRTNRDVDHTMHSGKIRLDSKHQSKRKHPVVNLSDLEEAVGKAAKFRSDLGGLILWNQEEEPVVVFRYKDWLEWEAERGTEIKENTSKE